MRVPLVNYIVYGVGNKNVWQVLARRGSPKLANIPIEDLIAESLDLGRATAIAKVIGDGGGNFGVSITLIASKTPATYAATIGREELERFLAEPNALVESFHSTFRINRTQLEQVFGIKTQINSLNGIRSRISYFFARNSLKRNSICLYVPNSPRKSRGLFGYLHLFRKTVFRGHNQPFFATYPVKIEKDCEAILFSPREYFHAAMEFSSAINYQVEVSRDYVSEFRPRSVVDTLKSIWSILFRIF